jgi:hypothetical protein
VNDGRGRDALWIRAVCVAVGLALAGLAASAIPPSATRIARALELGIVSETTLAGYDPGRDLRAYAAALAVGVVSSVGIWFLWTRRRPPETAPAKTQAVPPCGWREIAVVALILLLGLLRFDIATNGWDAHYTFFAEEGQALAWTQVALDGGVIGRDAYCPYGPLAIFPFVAAFGVAHPSVWLWRVVFYLLDLPALVAAYVLLREITLTRQAAVAGLFLLTFHRMWPMPGISWSLLRVGLGLAALAALARFLRRGSPWAVAATGSFLGLSFFFSEEAGVASALACGVVFALAQGRTGSPRLSRRGALVLAAGCGLAALPVVVWFAARGALGALIENLLGFSRLRVLGHGALPFPDLLGRAAAWTAGPNPGTWEALREAIAALFGPAVFVVAGFCAAAALLRGPWRPAVAIWVGVATYGAALYVSPLSRPDLTHVLFAMPPAFILAVVLVERAVDPGRGRRPVADRAAAAAFVLAAVLGIAAFDCDTIENVAIFARQVGSNVVGRGIAAEENGMRTLELPRSGGVRLPTDRAAEVEWVVRYLRRTTGAEEPVWCFPAEPMLNFLADRPLASRYPVGLFAITREQRRELLDEVERRGVRRVVVNTKPIAVDGIPSREALPELWSYVETQFEREASYGRFVVMRRRAAATTPTRSSGSGGFFQDHHGNVVVGGDVVEEGETQTLADLRGRRFAALGEKRLDASREERAVGVLAQAVGVQEKDVPGGEEVDLVHLVASHVPM